MARVLVICDVSNLYLRGKAINRKVSYRELLARALNGRELYRAVAYGAQMTNEAEGFITVLRNIGFHVKFKVPKVFRDGKRKADWDVGMAVDMLAWADYYDTVVLCSADGDMVPAIRYLQARGIRVEVMGMNLSSDLRDTADHWLEMDSSFFEREDNNVAPNSPVPKFVPTSGGSDDDARTCDFRETSDGPRCQP